ncbi:MAG: hypothetical protein WDN25_29185 [Acetobacteraceae bacterium]
MSDTDIKSDSDTSFAVVVPNSSTDATVRDYLRLGNPDTTYEGTLKDFSSSTGGNLGTSAGALIYSTEQVQLAAPTINQVASVFSGWSGDNLSVVGDSSAVVSATRTWGSSDWPATATFQRADSFNTTLGTVTNLITGNSVTQWLGNDASTGTGGLLWSNYGTTQNVFGGQIVNMINGAIDVQGFGEVKIVPEYSIVAPTAISFAVTPAAGVATWATVIEKVAVWGGLISALAQDGLNATSSIATDVAGKQHSQNQSDMQDAMAAAAKEIAAATGAVLVLQAMAIAAGAAAALTAKVDAATALGQVTISDVGVRIKGLASEILVDDAGVTVRGPLQNFAGLSVQFA